MHFASLRNKTPKFDFVPSNDSDQSGPKVIKTFFMLISTEHEDRIAHKNVIVV